MAARGVHFALDAADAARVLAAAGDDEALAEVIEDIEERGDEEWLVETDKAWDAIHRCLTDGTLTGSEPRSRALCVLGGQSLFEGDDYIAVYMSPEEVVQVDAALRDLDEAWMRAQYDTLKDTDYDGPFDDADFEYTWENFQDVRRFFAKAGAASRAVLFTVDQ